MTFVPDDTAVCAQVDPEVFFPEKGGNGARDALALCRVCPLIDPCRDYALSIVVDGVWGGTTVRQRKTLRRDLGIVAVNLDHEERRAPCGTEAAKARHRRNDETCPRCKPADNRTDVVLAAIRFTSKTYENRGHGHSSTYRKRVS